ncbi:TPA: transcriptional regulator NrdR [Patescibacteria group bacterium]|nr:transcriptional regulator NrdR [Candidatus Gracilibacteria bacterium]
MKCPKCNNMDTKVIDSRTIENGQTIRRRRECEFCNNRFTTFERRGTTELLVIKKDGTKEMYDRQKLKKAILLSFAKRNIDKEQLENIINNLESQRSNDGNEITSLQIGEDILRVLKEIDPVAYVRFASVYRSFNNFDDFKKLID